MPNGNSSIVMGAVLLALSGAFFIWTEGNKALIIAPLIGLFLLGKGLYQRHNFNRQTTEGPPPEDSAG